MRLNEALGDIKPLDVKFASGGVLHIQYRPPSYTVAQIEQAQADERPDRLITMIQQIVVEWDLDDDTGERIDLANAEEMKQKVPLTVYNQIVRAIRDDNNVGEA